MREIADPRTAMPDVAMAGRGVPGSRRPVEDDDRAERLRRRDQLIHHLELARRARQRRVLARIA